jgi:uncharacterized tellurite resistance protein B-like protein
MGRAPVELYADCTHCRLEGGVAELYDPDAPASRFGAPSRSSCRLCAVTIESIVLTADGSNVAVDMDRLPANACPACRARLDSSAVDAKGCEHCGARCVTKVVVQPLTFPDLDTLLARLSAWATSDNLPSAQALLQGHFVTPDPEDVLARLRRGDPIPTVVDPFALGGGRVVSNVSSTALDEPAPRSVPRDRPPPSAPPRAIVYPLVSVIAADGELQKEEREVVDRFLLSEGLAPLSLEEFRVHRAEDVARLVPRDKREKVVELMCETACADGIADASEIRVIHAYAAAWQIPEEKVKFWLWGYEHANASGARQLWLKIRRFLLSSRWENQE